MDLSPMTVFLESNNLHWNKHVSANQNAGLRQKRFIHQLHSMNNIPCSMAVHNFSGWKKESGVWLQCLLNSALANSIPIHLHNPTSLKLLFLIATPSMSVSTSSCLPASLFSSSYFSSIGATSEMCMQPFLGALTCKTPQSNYFVASLTDPKQSLLKQARQISFTLLRRNFEKLNEPPRNATRDPRGQCPRATSLVRGCD